MIVTRLFLCPEHVYVGHFGRLAGTEPMERVDRVRAVAGRGSRGTAISTSPRVTRGR